MTKTRVAQCHCGQVKVTCKGEPYPVFMCSCKLCQQRTGAPVHIGAWWPIADVKIEGETQEFTRTNGERGIEATFNFCTNCGTSIWWGGKTEGDSPLVGFYGVAGGCFADPEFPPPTHSVYERSKAPWIRAPEGTPCFSGMFDDPAVVREMREKMQERSKSSG